MENVVNTPRNRGALPRDYEELQIIEELDPNEPETAPEVQSEPVEADKPEPLVYTHVRVPEIRRGATRLLMGAAALCGAVSGVVMALTGAADAEALVPTLAGSFGEIFLARITLGAVFLGAELILGFFALGDWIVWLAPLCYAMGTSLRIAASGLMILLPSAAVSIAAVTLAAAVSATLSKTLMRLSKGGTVYLESSPRKSYMLAFLGYTVMTAAAAALEGALLSQRAFN